MQTVFGPFEVENHNTGIFAQINPGSTRSTDRKRQLTLRRTYTAGGQSRQTFHTATLSTDKTLILIVTLAVVTPLYRFRIQQYLDSKSDFSLNRIPSF